MFLLKCVYFVYLLTGKLESISKPIPAPKPPEPKPEKPIPRATILKTPVQEEPPIVPSASIIITKADLKASTNSLFPTSKADPINNSKSLIDLNSWDTPVEASNPQYQKPSGTVSTESKNQMVDLLFDMNEQTLGFEMTNTPMKQNESFVDLLGLQSMDLSPVTSNLNEVTQQQMNTMPFPQELLFLGDGLTQSVSNTSITSYKDSLLYDMVGSMEKLDNLNQSKYDYFY